MTENKKLAHSLESKIRTEDVILKENISFKSLLLSENILRGLSVAGFQKPSPIQLKALPVGRCGLDLTVKSKSGTGKTLVFGIIALETIKLQKNDPQVLILVPTREIAVQIQDVLRNIGNYFEGLNVQSFIGGLSLNSDKVKCSSCHIAVGTPGRVKQLIQEGNLATKSIRLFVLDEADKLMENSFQKDINEIFNSLSDKKQIIMCSATYPNELESFLNNYMLSPTFVSTELETPLLLGLKQFVRIVKSPPNIIQQTKIKNDELLKILSTVSFTQCLIFSNYQTRAESISNFLNRNGWLSTFISGAQKQTERLSSLSSLRDFKCRILISTDLTSRGIDASNVDLVINYDIPVDAVTYLHRMGRAGRYGATGNCVNLSVIGQETKLLQTILGILGGQNLSMPILDDNLNMETTVISKENILFAEVPDNIKEFTEKCKTEIIEMKKKTSEKCKKNVKDSKSNTKKIGMSGDDKIVKKVIEEKFSDIDISSVLGHLASGTLDLNTSVGKDKINTEIKDFYNELLPSPTKLNNMENGEKSSNEENNCQIEVDLDSICILQQLTREGTISGLSKEKPEKKMNSCENSVNSPSKESLKKEQCMEEVFCKNKALFSVAKSLSNIEMCGEDTNYLTEYLGMLKSKERSEATNVLKKNNENEDIKEEFNTIESRKKENYGELLENIFLFAYKYQVIDNCDNWHDHLPEEEKKKLEDSYVANNGGEHEYDEFGEENYDEYEEGDDDEEYNDYDFEMEKEIEVNFDKEMSQDASLNMDDYSFMKWIPVESENSHQSNDKKISLNNKMSASEHSTSTETSKKVDIFTFTQPSTAITVTNDNSCYHEQFSQYFQHCSSNLWQTGLSFDTVQNFDNWFCYNWQNQVATVRNFVQKKIKFEEMRRHEEHNKMQGQ